MATSPDGAITTVEQPVSAERATSGSCAPSRRRTRTASPGFRRPCRTAGGLKEIRFLFVPSTLTLTPT